MGRYCSHGLEMRAGGEAAISGPEVSKVRRAKLRFGDKSGGELEADEPPSNVDEEDSSSEELGGLSGVSNVKSLMALLRS